MLLLAPYPFKGTLTSRQAAEAMGGGVRSIDRDVEMELLPLGDGGSGTLDALASALGAEIRLMECGDPLGRIRSCRWGMTCEGVAIVEAAEVIPLAGVPVEERDPARLSTAGLGALIRAALEANPRRLIIGLGDSATHDCALGVGAALGYRFLDERGSELQPIGASLPRLHAIDPSTALTLPPCEIIIYCDVLNPLSGPDGAAQRFASQKGASQESVEMLERGGERFARAAMRDLGVDVASLPGAGAAGGLGAGLAGFLRGSLTSGADGVLDAVQFNERAARSALVITGEGRLDRKTLLGKGVGNVARRVKESRSKLLVIAGSIEGDRAEWEQALGGKVVELEASSDAVAAVREAVRRGMREEI